MERGKKQNTFFLFVWAIFILSLVSCQESKFDDEFLPGYNNDSASTTKSVGWDFSSSSDYSCESGSCVSGKNIIVSSGKAALQTVDTEHSGSDFSSGNHVGTTGTSGIQMLTQPPADETHVNTILPGKASNLVGYWRFDGDFNNELTPSQGGVIQGDTAISSDSKLDSGSVLFDGAGDSVENDLEFLQSFTISAWVKLEGDLQNVYSAVVSKGAVFDDNTNFVMGLRDRLNSNDYKFFFHFRNGSNLYGDGIDIDSYKNPTNLWSHLAVTFNCPTKEANYFLDGRLVATQSYAQCPGDGGQQLKIGAPDTDDATDEYFQGKIDDLAIWDQALMPSEIEDIFNGQNVNSTTELSSSWTPHYSNLVGYWKMDGNWQDSSGNGNHGRARGSSPQLSASVAKVGNQSAYLPGVNEYIEIADNASLDFGADDFTVSFWTNRQEACSALDNTWGVNKWNTGGSAGTNEWHIGFCGGANENEIRFIVEDTTNTKHSFDAGYDYPLFTWMYVTGVRRGENLEIYVDGQLKNSLNIGAVTINNVGRDLLIGVSAINNLHSNAYYDDVAIWNVALKAAHINSIYNRQKQKYASSYQSPVIDMGSSQSLTNLTTTTELPFAKELTTTTESSSDYTSLNASSDLSNGLVGYWPLDESSLNGVGGADFEDKSNNSNNGDESGTVSLGTAGILGNAVSLDGINDYVEFGSNSDFDFERTDSFSISLWVKVLSDANQGSLINKMDISSNYRGWDLWYCGTSNSNCVAGSIKLHLINSWMSNAMAVYGSTTINDGEWHHILVKYDGSSSASGIKAYIDSKSESLTTQLDVLTGTTSSSVKLRIGARTSGDRAEATIDEVAIWSRELTDGTSSTPNEIQELYRRGANRVKYQLRTCSDSTCSSDPEWKGPGGDGTTYFSELYNRVNTDIDTMFGGCYTSNPDVCDNTEFSLSGDTLQDPLNILFSDFPAFDEGPITSRYFQYRVLMEAEDNTACSSSACLPTVSSVNFTPSGFYYGGSPEIKSLSSITIPKSPSSIEETKSGSCTTTYQFSTDGTNYKYWNGSAWAAVSSNSDANSIATVSGQLSTLTSWPSSLYFKTFMASDGSQSCEIDSLSVKYTE